MGLSNSQVFADVSSNNGGIDPASYASAGYSGIAIKATEGTGYVNPYYNGPDQHQARDCHRHNLPVFHYHFAHPDESAVLQAEHFVGTVGDHFRRPGDFCMVDLEIGDPRTAQPWLSEFYSKVEALNGARTVLYTYLSYLTEGGLHVPSQKLWIAAYGSSRPGNFLWKFGSQQVWAWQYTDGGGFGPGPQRFAGIAGTSDGSWMNPSVARALRKQRKPR